ncbi:GAF domain-containing protein [Roseivivax sp. GX 12232]|uniref:sensor histidine kinase n=1 Tax=Roseivivax sp. GX 12232 TaxID=2900547 RepID=UPI001E4F0BF1|nr:histidine kinase dimerization/phosphoacceptor domain -containing protein [Roseivivax sp. GX 12232]MCE0504955.1 GAF domain-containing protein [Roseivivax sp. GX 12232]
MRAPTPGNQKERLEELRDFEVLDTGPEESFDEITTLIKDLCDAPIALVSFVDQDRQWFKARCGYDYPETPIDQAICAHTILEDGILEIPDTHADARTADNPLCIEGEEPIRFYAGAPLVSDRGHSLGALCVLDTRPRELTARQRRSLSALAEQVMRLLELRRAIRNEEVLRSEMDHRVKNSLQTVASFIRIYTSRAKSPETKEALAAISRRVNAISQLHAELYNTNQTNRVRLDTYIDRVVELLRPQMPANVGIETRLARLETESRTASQIAMIVSEFAANAAKHAFPDGRKGAVRVMIEDREDGGFRLLCEDNGIGGAATTLPTEETEIASIGMRLMESAAEQIGAEVEMGAGEGGYRLELVTSPQPDAAPYRARALSAE